MNIDIIVAILTSSLVATVVSQVISLVKSLARYKKRDKIILFFIIKSLATDALFQGYISSGDLKILEDAYAEYKALGGNGYADTLMAKVRELPLREDK